MPYELYLKETLNVGTSALIPCDSNHKPYAVMFEDDGETGYFYACTVTAIGSPRILDAVHVYNVKDVLDKDEASEIKIGWSPDGMQAILLINDDPHAVFDFEKQWGFCKTGFPPVEKNNWCRNDHKWGDQALSYFR